MDSEEFERILRKKYAKGINKFTGNKTRTVYELRNSSNKVKGWSLYVNGKCLVNRASFSAVSYAIYDREVIRTAKRWLALDNA